ncbi:DNA internalization-related competence protein ComEC/Rec2 [Pseudomonas savastanoi pv. phaseolicola]|nr:DNA internalization-related competence protein ComEC/Rec2 [Pseudomonas savastanoi pv. phaseolicola]
MRTGMIALASGLVALRFLPALPPTWLLLLMPILALMLLLFRTYPLALFLLGFTWACVSAQWALNDRLVHRLDGQTLWLQGKVVGLPSVAEGVVRFELEGARSRRAILPARIRVAWYGGPQVNSGERWRMAVKLKRPAGLVNPDAFDYEAWLLAQRICATGTVVDGQLLTPARGAWRDLIRQRLLAVDAQGREGGLAALVLGDGSGLSSTDWQVLQDTGTVHLLVISGQHIGLLAGVIYALVAGLARWGLWPRALPWLPCACALAFIAALGYGLLAGFEVPVRRACVMVAMVLLWRLRFRHLGVVWPIQRGADFRAAGDTAAGVLAVFRGGWHSGADFQWTSRCLELVAKLDACAVADRNWLAAYSAGAEPADQPQRSVCQFAGCALGQLDRPAACVAWNTAAAGPCCGRRLALAGRRCAGVAVYVSRLGCRGLARLVAQCNVGLGVAA